MKFVKPSRKLIYSLMALLLAGWMVIPFTRQLTFGPRIEGLPLCRLQDDLRKSALGSDYRPGFLDKIGQYLRIDEPANGLNLLSDDGRRRVSMSLVDDNHPKVRSYALSALRWHISSPAVLDVYLRARDDSDNQCRLVAADGILRFSDDGALKSNTFARAFNDPDKMVRSAAYWHLGDQADDSTVLRFVPRIVDPVDPKIRSSLIIRIWRVRATPQNMDALTSILKDARSQWRAAAACAAYGRGKHDAETVAVIRSALQGNEGDNRETMNFVALVPSLAKGLLPQIVHCAWNHTDIETRWCAIQALGSCGSLGVPYLMEILEAGDARLQVNCIYALGNIGKDAQQAIPQLRAMLKDSRIDVRRGANHALIGIDPSFVPQEQFEPLPMMVGSPEIKK